MIPAPSKLMLSRINHKERGAFLPPACVIGLQRQHAATRFRSPRWMLAWEASMAQALRSRMRITSSLRSRSEER